VFSPIVLFAVAVLVAVVVPRSLGENTQNHKDIFTKFDHELASYSYVVPSSVCLLHILSFT